MTEQAQPGERRVRFTPDHDSNRTEDKILLAINGYVETSVEAPNAFQYDDGSPTQGIAMIRNDAGEIVAHAIRMGGRTAIHPVAKGIDEMALVYSNWQEPYIIGVQRYDSSVERMTQFTPTRHRAEYTARLTALAIRIGALKLPGQGQPKQPTGRK